MTAIIVSLIAVFLMGFADLYRGAKAGLPRFIEKASLGILALMALTGSAAILLNWTFALVYVGLFAVACSVSWGAVISGSLKNDAPEKFQAHVDAKQDKGDWYLVGWFRKSPFRGLFARSIVWGVLASLPLFLFGYTAYGYAMLAVYSVVMVLAVKFLHLIEGSKFDQFIGRMCLKLVDKDRSWARHEVYRGWIAGALLMAIGLFI